MKLLGIVVLFYPETDVWSNIETYIDGVDKLIIWFNSPFETIPLTNEKIIVMGKGQNVGVGKALNEAVMLGINNGYTHILTMDQDSSFPEGLEGYRDEVSLFLQKNIGCFCPNSGWNSALDKGSESYCKMDNSITSGSIYPISIFEKIGLFRDDFFIDAIDIEFGYRIRQCYYDILCMKNILMKHSLGNKTEFKFFLFRFSSINYPPIRIYYIMRNHVITNRMYTELSDSIGFFRFFLFRRFIQILLYEPNKIMKIKAMFYGLYHGLRGKTGPCLIDF